LTFDARGNVPQVIARAVPATPVAGGRAPLAARLPAADCRTAGTKVFLASGTAVPISALKPGDKVLATNVKTGKTQAETVAAVLVHHDTDLYDLKVTAGHRTTVIHTTASHLYWDTTTRQWVKARAGLGRKDPHSSLRYSAVRAGEGRLSCLVAFL